MSAELVLIETGTANLASIRAAFGRLGVATRPADPAAVRDAERVCLPGVGAFGAAAARLTDAGLLEPLRERITRGLPTLAVCVGHQLLAEQSEESPGARGLGLFPGPVTRFGAGLRVPQMGWNALEVDPEARYLAPGQVYFANSYRLSEVPPGWRAAWATHGEPFVAALERQGVLTCQFHPELSGRVGRELLARWLERAPEEASCSYSA